MNCISSKIINQKLIINGVQSILKDRRILHSSFRYNHVFTYKLNRKPISNRNFRLNSVTLARLASTNVYQQNSILDTESFDSLKDIGVNVSQSSFNSDELLSNFSSDVISKVAEPSFTSLGLGNGTPSGLIQLGLEYMHLEFGIPWWGTIVATTAIVRLLMVPFVMNSKKHHMAMQKIMPEIEALKAKSSEAKLTGNPYEARLYEQQMQNLFKDNNIQIFKPMLPALVQGFFFLSFFWALHPMAALPIESLRNGGILWFTDLTAADPYYIMPVFCGGTVGYLLTYANDAFKMSQIYSLYLKAFLYLIPLSVIAVTATFPSIILLYWSTNNVLSVAQFLVFRSEAFKKYFDAPMTLPKTKQKRPV